MLANAASTAPSSRGNRDASPTTRSTFDAPRALRFSLATSSIAGALSIPMTRSTRGASPAATKPVPVPTSATWEAWPIPETSAIFSMTRSS